VVEPPDSAKADNQLLCRLARLWESELKRGLEVRHQMGSAMNKRLGLPTQRQQHGKAVLKKASKRLGIAESELSRMRWFAHHFDSLADLKSRHPGAVSWTKVKKLLPTLQPQGDQAGAGSGRARSPSVTRLVRSLEAATKALSCKAFTPSGPAEEQFIKAFQALRKVVHKRFPQLA
jgi:hypothetical protein